MQWLIHILHIASITLAWQCISLTSHKRISFNKQYEPQHWL